MTTLEKAARALAMEYYAPGDATLEAKIAAAEQWSAFVSLTRAVLMAVRAPGGYVIDKGATTACGLPDAEATWERMIDTILAEQPA